MHEFSLLTVLSEFILEGPDRMNSIFFKSIPVVFLLALHFGFASSISAQKDERHERLKMRVEQFFARQKEGDYESIFTMLAEERRKTTSKKAFVELYKKADSRSDAERLTVFAVTGVGIFEESSFGIVEGCGGYTRENKTEYYDSVVEAIFESGDWYFRSLIGGQVTLDRGARECRIEKKRKL